MKKAIFLSLCLISMLGLSSCKGDDFIEQTPTVVEQKTSGRISFTYKDVAYSSNYEIDGENCKYDNPEFISIFNKLQELPNLALLIKSDETYEYFDSYEELCNKKDIKEEPTATTRTIYTGMTMATLKIYTRTKYRGDIASFTINGNRLRYEISDLSTIGLDEQITSMRLDGECREGISVSSSCTATFFEHKNYQGRSTTFRIIYPNIELGRKDFANVLASGPLSPIQPISLDDITSSIKFGF